MKASKASIACEKDMQERLNKYLGKPIVKVVDQKTKLPKTCAPKITSKKLSKMINEFVKAGYMVLPCDKTNARQVELVILKRFKGDIDYTYEPSYKPGGEYNPCKIPRGCIEVACNPIMELK